MDFSLHPVQVTSYLTFDSTLRLIYTKENNWQSFFTILLHILVSLLFMSIQVNYNFSLLTNVVLNTPTGAPCVHAYVTISLK